MLVTQSGVRVVTYCLYGGKGVAYTCTMFRLRRLGLFGIWKSGHVEATIEE